MTMPATETTNTKDTTGAATKKNPGKKEETAEKTKARAQASEMPAGFERRTSDVAGFYDGESTLRFIPIEVKAFDGNQDSSKPSCLIIGKLTSPAKLTAKDDDKNDIEVDGKANDMVGVWYKPGMRDLIDCAGIEVFMRRGGNKDVGKMEPMKLYEIFTKQGERGKALLVTVDQRDDSLNVNLPFRHAAGALPTESADDAAF